jgi:hypothetical protein
MKVRNVHQRLLDKTAKEVGALIDGLASENDRLWPHDSWPAMKFNRPLSVGAVGGHGPILYKVEKYEPGNCSQFKFLRPKGFEGCHRFEIEEVGTGQTILRHVIEMQVEGEATPMWLLMIRPLHDALLEDALDRAEGSDGLRSKGRNWSAWVKWLRRITGMSKGS